MGKTLKRSLIVGIIMMLLSTACLPVLASNELSESDLSYSTTDPLDNNDEPMTKGGLIDNVTTKCYGTYLTDVFLILIGIGTNFLRIEHTNNHDKISMYIDIHVKLETRGGKVLVEFDHNRGFKTGPHELTVTCIFNRYDWKYFHYRFGYFDLTLDISIREDGSHEKLLFHGFVYGCGARIINPDGEVIG